MFSRRWSLPLLAVLAALALLPPFFVAYPQEKTLETKKRQEYYLSAKTCAVCHKDLKALELAPLLCRCDELVVWHEKDMHSKAYKVLVDPDGLGKLMEMRLGWKDVASDGRCLNCHGVNTAELPKESVKEFDIRDGVSCVVCHGPYYEWNIPHGGLTEKPRELWRGLDRETKERKYGLRDVWHPTKRAELCASCHVGNVKEGKVVTHAMYAAGHPPLPGLEVATFSDAMPRHWDYHAEKKPEILAVLAMTDPKLNVKDLKLEKAELVVLAGLVSFRETIRLLGDQAGDCDECEKNKVEPKNPWPDFANYDCYACHHNLKSKSWRQQRGYPGKPGRPTLRYWPTTLVKLALDHLGEDEEQLRNALKPLQQALDASPFGEPKSVAEEAKKVTDWIDRKIQATQKKPFDKKAAQALLAKLEQMGTSAKAGDILDYDSARQVAWAYGIIAQELDFDPTAPDKKKYPDLPKSWDPLNATMNLELPKREQLREDFMPKALKRLNEYDPFDFRKLFANAIKK